MLMIKMIGVDLLCVCGSCMSANKNKLVFFLKSLVISITLTAYTYYYTRITPQPSTIYYTCMRNIKVGRPQIKLVHSSVICSPIDATSASS
jgi:hypothetical protein